jgi:hypothetical protein
LLTSLYLDEDSTKKEISSLLVEWRGVEPQHLPPALANKLDPLLERLELHRAVQGYWARGEQYREMLFLHLKLLDSNA